MEKVKYFNERTKQWEDTYIYPEADLDEEHCAPGTWAYLNRTVSSEEADRMDREWLDSLKKKG